MDPIPPTEPVRPPTEPVRLTADDPLAALAVWVADGRVDAAATDRARQRWLERQAAEDASLGGVLVDLAERGTEVVVRTVAGRVTRGLVAAVGTDFTVVRQSGHGDVVIPMRSLASVKAAPGEGSATGARALSLVIALAEALIELSGDRPEVVVSAGGEDLKGVLSSAGRDLIDLTINGPQRETVHVATASIDHLVVVAR